MQKQNNALDDFKTFMSQIEWLCQHLRLNLDDYTSSYDFFRDVMGRVSVGTLQSLDTMMGDDYLHDDLLGEMHRAVRSRLQELRPTVSLAGESGWSA
ncbi:hypothetical protein EDM58_21850 [Brevibacillus panacihumi]|uniref:Uncharacterized protein n=1 Tax=Brevibacillus panacihumi TaxID=497735 RepID=A0A3M8C9E5_9BACL|nr:hypothetical protein EDM58_21850 [Brevibacillus panacihumi]